MITLQLAVVLGAATLSSGADECASMSPKKTEPLKEMSFPKTYKVSGVISDWINKNVTAFVEVASPDRMSTLISSNSTSSQWLTIKADKNTFLYNESIGHCDKSASPYLESLPGLSAVSKNLSSLSTLMEGLMDFSRTNPGTLRGNKVVAGIEGVHWVSCVNGTNGSANLQVEVVFAGEESLKPPSSAFNNPLVLLLSIAEYGNFSGKLYSNPWELLRQVDVKTKEFFLNVTNIPDNGTLRSHVSVEFDSHSSLSDGDNHLLLPPPGVVCNGWMQEPIPLNVSDPFSVHIQIVDEKKLHYESLVHYAAAEGVVIVSGAKNNDVMPFINEKGVPKDVTTVVHDFNSGYEYGLDYSRCLSLSALSTQSDDVIFSNGIYSMRPVAQILIPPGLTFGNYGSVKSESGRVLAIYRGTNNKTNENVEIHFDGDQLNSYTTYKVAVNGSLYISSYTKFTHAPVNGVSSFLEQMRACFVTHSGNRNDIFTLAVKSKSIKEVYEQGVEKVASALADALRNIAPINPLRVRVFFDSGTDDSLGVFFSVEEKTDVKPSPVPKYNYTTEVSSTVLIEKLNETISQGDWKFNVPSTKGKSEEWLVVAKSLKRYTPSSSVPTPGYSGYTGGAMFVLGIFTLLLGVSIGAGGVFFVTKRQRISNLAYQVFE